MPVRKVVTRSPHRRVGYIACPWFQSNPIEYESLLERDFVRIALLDPDVSSIVHQPFYLELEKSSRYTPDFLLTGPHKRLVVEVKPQQHADNARNTPRLARAKDRLREGGYQFLVATERFIWRDRQHERAAILLRYARGSLLPHISDRILALSSQFPSGMEIGELASRCSVPISAVLHLVGRRKLRLSRDLRHATADLVFPVGGPDATLRA